MLRLFFVLLISILTSAPAAFAQTEKPSPCDLPGVIGKSLCGWAEVPADHAAPASGQMIRLRVVILPASDTPREADPIVYLAGGPGASSVANAGALSDRLRELRRHRDVVMIDQRGTGESSPFNCRMVTSDGRSASLGSTSFPLELIELCGQGNGAVAGTLFTTWQAAEDLAEAAEQLGYAGLNLYGVSYGTRLGLVFLRRHPERVRTLTVQSVVLPSLPIPLAGTLAADAAMERLFADCEADEACSKGFPKLRAQARELLSNPGETGFVYNTAITAALYDPRVSAGLPAAIEGVAAYSSYQQLLNLAGGSRADAGSQSLSSGAYLAVLCTEDLPYLTEADMQRAAATLFTDRNLRGLARTCSAWPEVDLPTNARELPSGDTPVLLLAGDLDPVTSAEHAELAAARLPQSKLIVMQATGHSGAANDCAVDLLTQFIATGEGSKLDAQCATQGRRPRFQVPFPEAESANPFELPGR